MLRVVSNWKTVFIKNLYFFDLTVTYSISVENRNSDLKQAIAIRVFPLGWEPLSIVSFNLLFFFDYDNNIMST